MTLHQQGCLSAGQTDDGVGRLRQDLLPGVGGTGVGCSQLGAVGSRIYWTKVAKTPRGKRLGCSHSNTQGLQDWTRSVSCRNMVIWRDTSWSGVEGCGCGGWEGGREQTRVAQHRAQRRRCLHVACLAPCPLCGGHARSSLLCRSGWSQAGSGPSVLRAPAAQIPRGGARDATAAPRGTVDAGPLCSEEGTLLHLAALPGPTRRYHVQAWGAGACLRRDVAARGDAEESQAVSSGQTCSGVSGPALP